MTEPTKSAPSEADPYEAIREEVAGIRKRANALREWIVNKRPTTRREAVWMAKASTYEQCAQLIEDAIVREEPFNG